MEGQHAASERSEGQRDDLRDAPQPHSRIRGFLLAGMFLTAQSVIFLTEASPNLVEKVVNNDCISEKVFTNRRH
jgi:hypothetical protein